MTLANPLAGLCEVGASADEKTRGSLQIIEHSLKDSDKINNDLLEYSREVKLKRSITDPKISILEDALFMAAIRPTHTKGLSRLKVRLGKVQLSR